MKERNALYWPISALRVLLKARNNPEVRIARPEGSWNVLHICTFWKTTKRRFVRLTMSALPFQDWAVVQKMLGHREKHTEKETWHLYKLVLISCLISLHTFFIHRRNLCQPRTQHSKTQNQTLISGDSLLTLFEIAVALETPSPKKRYFNQTLEATLFNLRKVIDFGNPPKQQLKIFCVHTSNLSAP